MRAHLHLTLVALAASAACTAAASRDPERATVDDSDLTAALPPAAAELAPAMSRTSGTGAVDGEHLADVDTCGSCHQDVYAQQQASAHATSSLNNPIYRFGIDKFRVAVSTTASQMCGGCHDVALLVDGAMPAEVTPADERAHAGVTCRVCHGIEAATNSGNGSYTLSRIPIPLPDGTRESIARHKRAAAPIDQEALCGSCHRSFLSPDTGNDHFLAGMDELSSWKSSAYNHSGVGRIDDPVARQTCVDCHMPMVPAPLGDAAADPGGAIRSHRFPGGHTWLAAMLDDGDQLAAQVAFLRDALTVDIAAARDSAGTWTLPADGAPVPADGQLTVDVVVRNVGVGHHFPAGVRDAVDSWIELTVTDARGDVVLRTGDDADAHRFRVLVGDRHARPQLVRNTQDFYEPIVDHTIPARDARVIRYALALPDAPQPLHIEATLLHRSRNLDLQRAVCADATTERSRAFDRERTDRDKPSLDPCAPQPVTEIARGTTWIGTGASDRIARADQRPAAARLYEHGLGLLAELPREASAARTTLLAALDATEPSAAPMERAKIYAALGAVYAGAPCGPSAPAGWSGCASRLREGERWLDEAEAIAPGHPAIARTRARLYERSWRWDDAAAHLAAAVDRAPQNAGALRALATILSALGHHDRALAVARRGLALIPRDDDLLRVQAVALEALGAPAAVVAGATQAYEAHRRAERPTQMRAACATRDAACARERLQVHQHTVAPRRGEPKHAR